MKRVLLAMAAVLVAAVAQAETIYVTPNSAAPWHSKGPFKSVIIGDDGLLVVHPGVTNQDLIMVANQPDSTVIASTNVLMIDDQGKLVENLQVIVTPFGGPSGTVRVNNKIYHCTSHTCIPASAAKSRNKDMGDADSMTVTTNKDGSTGTSKTWLKP